jgi:hypothetical protein
MSWEELLWAAITIGRPSTYQVFRYGPPSFHEAIFRLSLIRMAVEQDWNNLRRTDAFGYVSLEPGPSHQLHAAIVDPRGHTIAVQLYLVQPLRPRRWFLDGLGKLRRDEPWKGDATARRTGLNGLRGRMPDDTRHGANLNSNAGTLMPQEAPAARGHKRNRACGLRRDRGDAPNGIEG